MKEEVSKLLLNNREWAQRINESNPEFFATLARQQAPAYLWIGCSDSRVPANEIVGMMPGEVFVHRNVANVVVHSDLNCQSVIQFAVDVLKVRHIIVTGHYGCGGVAAALTTKHFGLIDNWLRHLKDIYHANRQAIDSLPEAADRVNLLCELNVKHQVSQVCSTTSVQEAWKRGQELAVHGWIYGLHDGLLKDLEVTVTGQEQVPTAYVYS